MPIWRRSVNRALVVCDDFLKGSTAVHTNRLIIISPVQTPWIVFRPMRLHETHTLQRVITEGNPRARQRGQATSHELSDGGWKALIWRGLADELWFDCSALPCATKPQLDVRSEQPAVLAYLAQLCDAALLEALDHHL